MKLNKLLVAAALSAVAVNASAAIDVGAGGDQTEIIFSAWDGVNGQGYTFDLNWNETLDSLAGAESAIGFLPALWYDATNQAAVEGNTVVDASLIGTGGIIYDTALTGFNLDANNVEWNISAFDNVGRKRLLTTADASVTDFDVEGQKLSGAVNTVSGYYPATASFEVNTDADTYALTDATNGAAYSGNFGNNWGNIFDTTNEMGAESFLYELAGASANPGLETSWISQVTGDGQNVIAKTYQDNGEWRLQIAIAQTAPIPEPQTYAMLLAGLGVMGASARRRIK